MAESSPVSSSQPSALQLISALWGMARPLIMVSVYLVFVLGILVAFAHGHSRPPHILLNGLTALTLVTLGIHYANEYADYETDRLARRTPYSGGSGVLPSGSIPRRVALVAAWVTAAAGLLIGALAAALGGMPPTAFALLIIGALGGWFYSMPPLRLAYRGWGEIDNAILGGLVLPLYGYALAGGPITPTILLAFVPFTLLAFNNLLATTWADRDADASVGKRTLATRHPKRWLRLLYLMAGLAAYAALWLLRQNTLPDVVAIGSWAALPFSIWGLAAYTTLHSPHPSVWAMVVALVGQLVGWWTVAAL